MTRDELEALPGWQCAHGTRIGHVGRGRQGSWGALMCWENKCPPVYLTGSALAYLQDAFRRAAESTWKARMDALAMRRAGTGLRTAA
jgi:hypothetical protein